MYRWLASLVCAAHDFYCLCVRTAWWVCTTASCVPVASARVSRYHSLRLQEGSVAVERKLLEPPPINTAKFSNCFSGGWCNPAGPILFFSSLLSPSLCLEDFQTRAESGAVSF
ncbi:unnamed protein product, partial [Laminaria digitata]